MHFHILPSGKILPCPLLHKRNKSTEGAMSISRKSTASPLSSPVWRVRRPVAVSGNRRDSETWLSGNRPMDLATLGGTIKMGCPPGEGRSSKGNWIFCYSKSA